MCDLQIVRLVKSDLDAVQSKVRTIDSGHVHTQSVFTGGLKVPDDAGQVVSAFVICDESDREGVVKEFENYAAAGNQAVVFEVSGDGAQAAALAATVHPPVELR